MGFLSQGPLEQMCSFCRFRYGDQLRTFVPLWSSEDERWSLTFGEMSGGWASPDVCFS